MSTSKDNAASSVNGQAKETQKAVATEKTTLKENLKLQEEKPELSSYHVAAKPAKSIEERLNRFQELEMLKDRREELTEALKQLDKFQISPTGGANLKLSDGKSNTFAIAHPSVIGEMIALAKSKLTTELQSIDEQFIL